MEEVTERDKEEVKKTKKISAIYIIMQASGLLTRWQCKYFYTEYNIINKTINTFSCSKT